MSSDVDALVALGLDLSAFEAELSKLPDDTQKAVARMERDMIRTARKLARDTEKLAKGSAKAQSRAAREAARAASQAARRAQASWNEQFQAIKGLSSAVFGGMAGDAFDFVDALGGTSGGLAAVGLALGSVAIGAVAIGAAAAGIVAIGSASVTATARLDELGLSALIPASSLASVDEYEQSTKELAIAVDVATIELASGLVPVLVSAADALIEVAGSAALARDAIGWYVDANLATGGELLRINLDILTLGLFSYATAAGQAADKTDLLAAATLKEAIEAGGANEEYRKMAITLGLLATEEQIVEIAADQAAAAQAKVAAAATAAAATARAAAAAERDEAAAMAASTQAAVDRIRIIDSLGASIDAMVEADRAAAAEQASFAAEAAAASAAAGQLEQGMLRLQVSGEASLRALAVGFGAVSSSAISLGQELSASVIGPMGQLAEIQAQQSAERAADLREQRADIRRTLKDEVEAFESSRADMTAVEQAAEQARLEAASETAAAEIKALRRRERAQKRATLDAFDRSQKLARTSATVESGVLALRLAAAFAPLLGPLAIPVAAATALTALQTNLAIINSQSPPKLHFGSSSVSPGPADIPDRSVVRRLEVGEGVVSRRGMSSPGSRELVSALNQGRAGEAGPVEARLYLDNRSIDAIVGRSFRRGGPSGKGSARSGARSYYARRS